MAYKALYRTYRPATFEAVAGQKHVIKTLQNALKQNKLAHAYLFCGPRGTGKTSVAKLLAKAVNCENEELAICNTCDSCLAVQNGTHPDVIEIDAASNNGVDEIRELIEKVKYAPIQGKYKVYIIDEVHMLSIGAFNALLKTLEEPPEHVIFILATTEPHKVIPTIISRCQRFDFSKVKTMDIKNKVGEILDSEGIKYEEEAVELVCTLADGGVRDALSIIEQCVAYAEDHITLEHVNEIYGITTEKERFELLSYILNQNVKKLLNEVDVIAEKGMDIKHLTADLMEMLKDTVIYSYTSDESLLQKITKEHAEEILDQRTGDQLLRMIDILIETNNEYRNTNNIQSYFELSLLKMSNIDYLEKNPSNNQLVKPVPVIEKKTTEIMTIEPVKFENNQVEEKTVEKVVDQVTPLSEEIVEDNQKIELSEIMDLDDEYYLGLLVGASKEKRTELNNLWSTIDKYTRELAYAKAATKLRDGQLVAAGKGYLLVCVEHQSIANSINLDSEIQELIELTKKVFNSPYRVFGIEKNQFKDLVEVFKVRSQERTLPEAIVIEHIEEVKKENTVDDKLNELFGAGMFEIVEEDTE